MSEDFKRACVEKFFVRFNLGLVDQFSFVLQLFRMVVVWRDWVFLKVWRVFLFTLVQFFCLVQIFEGGFIKQIEGISFSSFFGSGVLWEVGCGLVIFSFLSFWCVIFRCRIFFQIQFLVLRFLVFSVQFSYFIKNGLGFVFQCGGFLLLFSFFIFKGFVLNGWFLVGRKLEGVLG